LKFSTLVLTEKLQSHFFTVTEALNSDKYMTSLPLWVKRRHIGMFSASEVTTLWRYKNLFIIIIIMCRIWNLPTQKSYSVYTLTM